MKRQLKRIVKQILQRICNMGGVATTFRRSGYRGDYIPAPETEAAARQAGLTIGDYVERLWGVEGSSARVIERIATTGILGCPDLNVLEIGAGTGRYMAKVIAGAKSLTSYESYETNPGWAEYLARTYPVTTRTADGQSLSETADHAVDLVHAHGVFVYTPFLITMRYLQEVGRVIKPEGFFVADFYTEETMTPDLLGRWLDSPHQYPAIVPLAYVTDFLGAAGFVREDSFFNPHGMGRSNYLVFRRVGLGVRGEG